MFRFQWLPEQHVNTPWWGTMLLPSLSWPSVLPLPSSNTTPETGTRCPGCARLMGNLFTHPRCLEPGCRFFTKVCLLYSSGVLVILNLHVQAHFEGLSYHPTFLNEIPLGKGYTKRRDKLRPTAFWNGKHGSSRLINTGKSAWGGFLCEKCGKLTSRTYWIMWHCSNCPVGVITMKNASQTHCCIYSTA